MIDYNMASITYDHTRTSDERVLNEFIKKINFNTSIVLDFGCGTGNYLKLIKEKTGNLGFGVEPSLGMREKAKKKNQGNKILEGSHEHIPFEDKYFDFIYMTDVIHHVPDLSILLHEITRVLKRNGIICIATQSWTQIEARWYNKYFPSLSTNEKNRYPDIDIIIEKAYEHWLQPMEVTIIESNPEQIINEGFIRNVEEKNFSMFRLISDEEFQNGLFEMKKDIGKMTKSPGRGESLVWLKGR